MRDVCCADSLHGLPIYVRSKDEMLSFLYNEHFLCHPLYHSLMDYQQNCRIPRRGSAPLAGVQHAAGARGHRRGVQHGPVRRRQHPAAAGRGQHAGEPQGAARAAAAARPVPGAAGRRPVWRRGLGVRMAGGSRTSSRQRRPQPQHCACTQSAPQCCVRGSESAGGPDAWASQCLGM